MSGMDAQTLLAGRYRLGRRIGSGGMGHVWAAHDTVLGRDVAVKVQQFDPEGDRASFDRFVREARTAAGLQHPNVVTIFDSGTDRQTAFLVMELLPGPTLDGHVAQHGPLPEPEAVALAGQVASGLGAAHGAGVVHRDIKPANLMFDAHGTLKIVDFGIAHLAQTAAARLTAPNTVIGSPPYLSPEQLQGRPADERSDLYALGCVITTMLTGRPPFEGENPLAYAHQHVSATPPRIRDRRPDLSSALDALVAQLLSKSPQDRPQSAQAVLERLTQSQPDWPSSEAAVPTTVIPAQTTRPMPADVAATAPPVMRPGQRSTRGRWIAAGAAVLILMAAVLIAAVMAENQTAGSPGASTSPAPSRQPATTSSQAPPSSSAPISPAPSRQPATKSATPSAEASSSTTTPSLQRALSDLREAVRAVSSSGQIEAKKAEELTKRVDELDKHLTEKRGEDAVKKVEDLDKYLAELSQKGELSPEGAQQIEDALQTVRELVAEG
jgi:serine/threonine protein kinase